MAWKDWGRKELVDWLKDIPYPESRVGGEASCSAGRSILRALKNHSHCEKHRMYFYILKKRYVNTENTMGTGFLRPDKPLISSQFAFIFHSWPVCPSCHYRPPVQGSRASVQQETSSVTLKDSQNLSLLLWWGLLVRRALRGEGTRHTSQQGILKTK